MDRPETLTLRQVAREVGIAPASIYGHFPDLGALIQHVLQQRYDELAETMQSAAQSAAEPLADLVARCVAYVHWGIQHPGEYRTLFGGGMPAEIVPLSARGAGEELLGSVSDSLARAAHDGEAVTDAAAWRAGLLLWMALHGLVALYNEHGRLPWPPLPQLIAETLALHTGRSAAEIAPLLPGS
ncbi:TetR/AcrR family transcriptional regulator [Gryllotalpicola koreensis]|uniref:TetR/AcrR family transcriptional regulator n=2 Tax=Gryllotalpicola koreensis TaxID=993086 RepID=A0ABP7ZQK9_9MICO